MNTNTDVIVITPKCKVRNELDTQWLTHEMLQVNNHQIILTQGAGMAMAQVLCDSYQVVQHFITFAKARNWAIETARSEK